MAELAEQVYVSVALLLPGFYALFLGHHIYGIKLRIGDLEKSIWSLVLSLVVLGAFLGLTRMSFASLVDQPAALLHPRALAALLGISTILAILLALLFRLDLMDRINRLFWWGSDVRTSVTTGWERILSDSEVLIVQTSTDKYYGYLRGYGFVDGEMGIRLTAQFTIRWNEDSKSESYHPYHVDIFVPYEQVISLVRVVLPRPSPA
jgi:uncharacterized protein DUF6338